LNSIVLHPAREKVHVFIMSSTEALPIARVVQSTFASESFSVVLWSDGVFTASSYAMEILEKAVDASDFGIVIAQPDDLLNDENGIIRAYDGDRVMAIFEGASKETSAVRSAMKIHYAVNKIINPLLKKQYPNETYELKHVIGIDTSELFVACIIAHCNRCLKSLFSFFQFFCLHQL
jgi:class 3 adenylate cyclase